MPDNAEYVAGDRSTCTRCGQAIWLSEFRPGEAGKGCGVWLVTEMASSCVCVPQGPSGAGWPHIPAVRNDGDRP